MAGILPPHGNSYWLDSTAEPHYPELTESIKVDVAIIGGGITGLTTAYLLKKSGKTVAVIDKGAVAGNLSVTAHTTGKVTSQHNLVYHDMRHRLGDETARRYGEANQAALTQIEKIIKDEKIDCDWQRADNYVFTQKPEQITTFKQEAETAQALGLPASFETASTLPFEVTAAVRFKDQARMHARKYSLGLAKIVNGDGSYVFEHTAATSARDSSPCQVVTEGGIITAKDIVIATSVPAFFPIAARGLYAALEYPQQSYIVAGRIDKEFDGMYISPDSPGHSILPITSEGGSWLLVGGEGHIPGLGGKAEPRYERLEQFAREQFDLNSIDYRWTAMDYMGYDGRPLIGKLYPWSKHRYIVTGTMKWGLTNGTVGAIILSDTILGKSNPWYSTFDSMRTKPITSIPGLIARNLGS